MDKKRLLAYDITKEKRIDDLHSDAYILRHKKTGARIALLENNDENKVFCIGFRTPPNESTGVMHILEHSVLCGSKEFPVKDPFIELAKGSLNTFLNAMTFPDKTVYPVASCNDKDFQNLMHVYLDAVFYPNIYQNDMTFKQEGWHYEMESAEDDLTINGVVYNEMKGAFSSPDDVLEREILNSLFPDTAYGEESGGDPKNIPDLTYEHYLSIHKKYYHPSNCYIYLYGNMDMVEKLDFIDKHYLSAFDQISVDSEIELQKSFDAPYEKVTHFSITANEPEKENTYLTSNCVIGENLNREHYLAFQIIDYALCSSQGAILKQRLLDAGIGKDVYSFYDNGIRQPYFSIVAKNSDMEKKDEFLRIIEETLQDIVKNGFDKDTLRAGLNVYEFRYREADFGAYPPGLMYGLQMFDSWLYDDEKPFIHIEAGETFKKLREAIDTDYYEKLVEVFLLNNAHQSIIIAKPQIGLVEEEEKKLCDKLAKYKASLSKQEIDEIVTKTHELHEYQDREDSLEALSCIPVLERSDIKKETEPLYNEIRSINEHKSIYHPIETNGIDYIRFLFDANGLSEEYLPYLPILKAVLGNVDTKTYTFTELYNQINIKTGGIVPVINVYTDINDVDKINLTFEWKAKTLKGSLEDAFHLIKEMIFTSDLENEKRLYEIIAEMKSKLQSQMMVSGHNVASGRATSYFSKAACLSDIVSGLPFYQLVEEIEQNFEQKKIELITCLKALREQVFCQKNMMFDFAGSESEYQEFVRLSEQFLMELPKDTNKGKAFGINPQKRNEGLLSSAQVQYVCCAGNFKTKNLPYTGALRVLKVIMGYDYLWTNIRVKGGAYGCMCSFAKSGESFFVSYRDPNLKKTVEVYRDAIEYVSTFDQDERSVNQYVIGAISEVDTPLTPSAKALRSMAAYLTNQTTEDLQKNRDEILTVTKEDIRNLKPYVEAIVEQDYLCVVGNEEKIKSEQDLFDNLIPLIHS